jgi:hypothetical protein
MMVFALALLAVTSTALSATASTVNSPYDFVIPPSHNAVNLKMIKAATSFTGLDFFIKRDPGLPATTITTLASYAFLIEHPQLKRRVLFDLGIRKDLKNIAPAAYKTFAQPDGSLPFIIDKDVPEQLVDGGVPLTSIDTLIWRSVRNLATRASLD